MKFPVLVRTLDGEYRLIEGADPVPRPRTYCDAIALDRFQSSVDRRFVYDPKVACKALRVWRDGGFWFVTGLQSPSPHLELTMGEVKLWLVGCRYDEATRRKLLADWQPGAWFESEHRIREDRLRQAAHRGTIRAEREGDKNYYRVAEVLAKLRRRPDA